MKKTLCFVVIYIGELKFFERFFSHFEDEYDIHLVFIRPNDERRQQMVSYSDENGYKYSVIDYEKGGNSKGGSIPILTPLLKHYRHTKKCKEFLRANGVGRLVAAKTSMPIEPLFKEANYMGIETRVVQRGHMPPLKSYVHIAELPFLRKVYSILIDVMGHVVDFIFRGPRYAFASCNPDKVGAIGEEGKTILPERRGYDPKSIEVLGSFEHQWTIELMGRLKSDEKYKEELIGKYSIDVKKKQILVVSCRYHHYIDARISYTKEEEKELVAIYDNVLRTIREVFSKDEAQIHFKLHPAEDNIYESYKKYDIDIRGNEAKIDELVCLSDLYISYPVTSANYMAVASGVSSIFVNLSPLQAVNDCAKDFGINYVATNEKDFKKSLEDFKSGKLEVPYDQSVVVVDSIDNTIRFIKSS